ncbi:hypothetical protein FGO68_gene13350 [Halteria grandinella]|uniref:Uncharacterized protein n=1 Tax=Halteria grandinella TaxID=5974 RepID=A0A8J8T9H2_HALGN|nr:hypothetical protein FGO68_gene13350 [Halteria grandinella]
MYTEVIIFKLIQIQNYIQMSTTNNTQQAEEQIRQRIRMQLQQRLPYLAQQLPESDRQAFDLQGSGDRNEGYLHHTGGLQSFGNILNSGGGHVNQQSSDFFNSDSFRATNTSHDNRNANGSVRLQHDESQELPEEGGAQQMPTHPQRDTRVVDLSNVQPFSNIARQQEERKRYEQPIQEENIDSAGQTRGRKLGTQQEHDYDQEEDQFSPLTQEEIAYQQKLIADLINENQSLKQQNTQFEQQFSYLEAQLFKYKKLVNDLKGVKEEVEIIKQARQQNESEQSDRLATENEILKSKIQDLETRVNTLSRAGDESRIEDKQRYEKLISQINEDGRSLNEKYRAAQLQLQKAEQESQKLKSACQQKDEEAKEMEKNWKQIYEEFSRQTKEFESVIRENKELKAKLQGEKSSAHLSVKATAPSQRVNHQMRQPPIHSQEDPQSQRDQYISLRNRSFSGDKCADGWINDLNSQVEQEFSERKKQGLQQVVEDNIKKSEGGYLRSNENSQEEEGQRYYQNKENQNRGNGQGQSYQNNINVKNYQPIQITIASPSEQGIALAQRCKKLEDYCRELIRINKVLDCENRIAIAQLINLTEPKTQLHNLSSALSFVGQSGKIYEKKSQSVGKATNQHFNRFNAPVNTSQQQNYSLMKTHCQQQMAKQVSLRNLNTLRQTGAPQVNQIFQNNNSSIILQKFNQQMVYSESQKTIKQQPQVFRQYPARNSQAELSRSHHQQSQSSSEHQPQKPSQALQPPRVVMEDPLLREEPNELDKNLNGLQKEIEERSGEQLPIKKIQAGYYQLDGNIVNLKLDENQQRILIRIQGTQQSSQFADFIEYLVIQGYLQNLGGANE